MTGCGGIPGAVVRRNEWSGPGVQCQQSDQPAGLPAQTVVGQVDGEGVITGFRAAHGHHLPVFLSLPTGEPCVFRPDFKRTDLRTNRSSQVRSQDQQKCTRTIQYPRDIVQDNGDIRMGKSGRWKPWGADPIAQQRWSLSMMRSVGGCGRGKRGQHSCVGRLVVRRHLGLREDRVEFLIQLRTPTHPEPASVVSPTAPATLSWWSGGVLGTPGAGVPCPRAAPPVAAAPTERGVAEDDLPGPRRGCPARATRHAAPERAAGGRRHLVWSNSSWSWSFPAANPRSNRG